MTSEYAGLLVLKTALNYQAITKPKESHAIVYIAL
jgi:hypothetical protein